MLNWKSKIELAGETLMNDYNFTREAATNYVIS